MYEYVGQVNVGARASIDDEEVIPPPPSGWKVRGTLKLQRRDESVIAAQVKRNENRDHDLSVAKIENIHRFNANFVHYVEVLDNTWFIL